MAEYKNVENIKKLFDEEFKKTRRLIQQGETHLDNLAEGFLEADRVIFRIPTADVVEVVRCKDCSVPHNKWTGCPNLNGLIPPPNFYCAKGERSTDNAETN